MPYTDDFVFATDVMSSIPDRIECAAPHSGAAGPLAAARAGKTPLSTRNAKKSEREAFCH